MMERSLAIKCPSIQYHLAGTKKIQQALASPGVLERFFDDKTKINEIRGIFTGIFSLDHNDEGMYVQFIFGSAWHNIAL